MLMGVVPAAGIGNQKRIRVVAVGPNESPAPCVVACDAMDQCQGFTVDSMSIKPPSSCQLHGHIDRLVDAPCA